MKNIFTSLDTNDYKLKSDQIDVWQLSLNSSFQNPQSILRHDELERANRFYFEHHQRRFTMARAQLRCILAKYTQTNPHELIFGENQYGKPYLIDYPHLQFNLSHSEEWALVAVGKHHPLGIDLEFFSARPYEGIAQHMFSPHENEMLQSTPNTLKPLVFYRIWSQKEAFIKACGLGLSYPTKTFDVPGLSFVINDVFDALNNQSFKLVSFQPRISCCAALCYHPHVQSIRYKR